MLIQISLIALAVIAIRSWRRRRAAEKNLAARFVSRDPAIRILPMNWAQRDALLQASRDAIEAAEKVAERKRIDNIRAGRSSFNRTHW